MSHHNDDRWLDALAGRVEPSDHETRQAASLHDYFTHQAVAQEALDPQTEKRIANLMAARLAVIEQAESTAGTRTATSGNLRHRLMNWLFPDAHAHAGRMAALTAAVLAVLILPLSMEHSSTDDPDQVKAIPSSTVDPEHPVGAATIFAADPVQEAAALQALLERHGVSARVQTQGDARVIEASVPVERLTSVQADLNAQGVVLSSDGLLYLTIRKMP